LSKTGKGFLQVEGKKAFGHYAVDWLIPQIIHQLDSQAVCLAAVRNIGHVGRLGGYVETLALHGCLAIMTASYALDDYESVVAPPGGTARLLGTNPIAIAAPTKSLPFVFDASTSAGTVFGIINAARISSELPAGVLLDAHGSPTIDPNDFFAGGLMLPFGGHKGFGLSLGMCLLSALSGDCNPASGRFGGVALIAIKTDLFNNGDDYLTGVDDFLSIIRATPSMPGVQVRIPGDRTHAEREQRRVEGVDLSQTSWDLLMECHEKLGLPAETRELEAR
jgi:LDH2 family malate/lactate/ureidoglycolate dehydrogenase